MTRKLVEVLMVATTAIAVAVGCSAEEAAAPDEESEYGSLRAHSQYGELIYACLTEKGWEVELTEFGEIAASIPGDQRDTYLADTEACRKEHGLDKPAPPMSRETAGEYFDLMVKAAECVEGLGYEVPEPPSREAYIAKVTMPEPGEIWYPYSEVMNTATNQEELDAVLRACPEPERPDFPD